jgi:orotidine-5'-phosphate decarboxylase
MTFQEKLLTTIVEKESLLCIGIDPVLEQMPDSVRRAPEPLVAFSKAIIDAAADLAAAFKINTAFYEAYGSAGWRALEKTFRYLPSNALKIADAKRGDIGNTARMYAQAFFEQLGADALTVNPYLGGDSVKPFIERPEKGVFFLCLTSNPGARDLQYFSDGSKSLHEKVAALVQEWNTSSNCGLVVGATHPDELSHLRKLVPDLPFLIPGIGAQGGDLQASVQYGTDAEGTNALYNSSRAILYASPGEDFAAAARVEAERTRDAINQARLAKVPSL